MINHYKLIEIRNEQDVSTGDWIRVAYCPQCGTARFTSKSRAHCDPSAEDELKDRVIEHMLTCRNILGTKLALRVPTPCISTQKDD